MSVIAHIAKKMQQKAVYWGTPVNDGRGKYTFNVLTEVDVRWEDQIENFAKDARSRIHIGKDGREFRPSSIIYTTSIPTGGWDLDGYLFLGTIADLSGVTTPYDVRGAYEIKQIDTLSELNNVDSKMFVIYL